MLWMIFSKIFVSVVVPTTTFGCEVWVLNESDLEKIETFQKTSWKKATAFQYKLTNSLMLLWARLDGPVHVYMC